jgi:hypothetical protein
MTRLYENRRAADESTRLSAVVVVPTRELAHQVSEVLKLLQPTDNSKPSSSSRKLSIRKLVGAVTPRMLNSLQLDPPHVVVGLPHTVRALPCFRLLGCWSPRCVYVWSVVRAGAKVPEARIPVDGGRG